MTQATAPGSDTLDRVRSLMSHPLYDETNPNRVRALLQSFATGNPTQFARARRMAGFELVAESVLEIDKRNPQVASRLLTSFRSWRALDPQRSALAESALLKDFVMRRTVERQPRYRRQNTAIVCNTGKG